MQLEAEANGRARKLPARSVLLERVIMDSAFQRCTYQAIDFLVDKSTEIAGLLFEALDRLGCEESASNIFFIVFRNRVSPAKRPSIAHPGGRNIVNNRDANRDRHVAGQLWAAQGVVYTAITEARTLLPGLVRYAGVLAVNLANGRSGCSQRDTRAGATVFRAGRWCASSELSACRTISVKSLLQSK